MLTVVSARSRRYPREPVAFTHVPVPSRRRGTLCPMARERITVDPNRMRGLPCFRGTRVTVSAIFDKLAAGASLDELLVDYPHFEPEDVAAAFEYAAESRLSDVGLRAHRLVESSEGKLIDDEVSIRRLLVP